MKKEKFRRLPSFREYCKAEKRIKENASANIRVEVDWWQDCICSILNQLRSVSGEDIIDTLDIKIKSEQLKKYIETKLSGREKTIICLRYGLHGGRPLPQREVASLLHISRSYVSRLEKKVLEQMREYFQKD